MAKISGFAKFEVDLKLTSEQFNVLILQNICTVPPTADDPSSGGFSADKFDEVVGALGQAYAAEGGSAPYAGDLENETYKAILQAIRDFNTSELSAR